MARLGGTWTRRGSGASPGQARWTAPFRYFLDRGRRPGPPRNQVGEWLVAGVIDRGPATAASTVMPGAGRPGGRGGRLPACPTRSSPPSQRRFRRRRAVPDGHALPGRREPATTSAGGKPSPEPYLPGRPAPGRRPRAGAWFLEDSPTGRGPPPRAAGCFRHRGCRRCGPWIRAPGRLVVPSLRGIDPGPAAGRMGRTGASGGAPPGRPPDRDRLTRARAERPGRCPGCATMG